MSVNHDKSRRVIWQFAITGKVVIETDDNACFADAELMAFKQLAETYGEYSGQYLHIGLDKITVEKGR